MLTFMRVCYSLFGCQEMGKIVFLLFCGFWIFCVLKLGKRERLGLQDSLQSGVFISLNFKLHAKQGRSGILSFFLEMGFSDFSWQINGCVWFILLNIVEDNCFFVQNKEVGILKIRVLCCSKSSRGFWNIWEINCEKKCQGHTHSHTLLMCQLLIGFQLFRVHVVDPCESVGFQTKVDTKARCGFGVWEWVCPQHFSNCEALVRDPYD